jgi:hypothetical protein
MFFSFLQRHLSLRRASAGTLSSYRWDMVSQRQRGDWDNSSQESQDTGPITNISSIAILVTEYAMCVHRPLRNKGNTRSSAMRQHVGETLAVSRLELFHRASTHGDLQAWAAFQQSLEETVLTWFHDHPGSQAACRLHGERHFVAQAFERLRQAVVQRQVACETFSGMLVYLRASLNGAILEMLRVSKRPRRAISSPWPDGEDRPDSSEVWDRLQARLSNQRERRLAYLLYHCGLEPAEIVRGSPLEWSDVHEVARLRRIIFMRLIKD